MAPVAFLIALASIALLSLASRRWRTTVVPWAAVPLIPLAIFGTPLQLLVGVLTLVVVELPGRLVAAPEVLATSLIAVLVNAMPLRPADPLLLLPPIAALLLLISRMLRRAGSSVPSPAPSLWTEAAGAVILTGGSALAVLGLQYGNALPAFLGFAIPAALPALLRGGIDSAAREHAYREVLAGLPPLLGSLIPGREKALEELVTSLHTLLTPLIGHDISVIAINPPFAGEGTSLAVHPVGGNAHLRIAERLRRLFESRRVEELHSPFSSHGEKRPLLHPDYSRQVVVPVRYDTHLVALLACLGRTPLHVLSEATMARVCALAEQSVRLCLENRWLHDRAARLERRMEDEIHRMEHLLAMSQAIYTSPDLRSVTSNLVRAARLGFGLSWCAVLLDARRNGIYRLTARSGLPRETADTARRTAIPLDTLQRVVAEGRSISRCSVITARRWPMEGFPTEQEHLILAPIGSDTPPPAYFLFSPGHSKPMLDLGEVRALEIVLDQAASVISSALHFEELKRQTLVDSLTGIANRRSLDTVLGRLLDRLRGHPVSVAMIDADDFKTINDRFGHHVGDVVLRELAALLSRSLRARDFAARYGGEEFCAVLPQLSGDQASLVLDRLRRSIAEHRFAASELSHPLHVTVSIGIATSPEDGESPAILLARADEALYEAKRLGKNRVVCTAEVGLWSVYDSQEPFA